MPATGGGSVFEEKMHREFKKALAFLICAIVGLIVIFGIIKLFGG
jgi:hypothetical protein